MLKKSLILNGQETAKSRPRAPRRGPRPSRTLPNGAQDYPKTDFGEIFGRFFPAPNLQWFIIFFVYFLLILQSSTLTKHYKNHSFFDVFAKSLFSKIIRKIFEKSSKNRPQIHEKSRKIVSKRDFEQRCVKNAKKTEKIVKNSENWPNMAPRPVQEEVP